MSIDVRVPAPPGKLPHVACQSAAQRYRAGAGPDVLRRALDRYSDDLEREIARNLAEHASAFDRAARRLEQIHEYLVTDQAQARWLRSFGHGKPAEREPILARLPSGHLAAVPLLLDPLHELVLDPRLQLGNGNGHRRPRRRGHDRRGKSPVMIAIAEAGLSTRILAAEMGVSKTAPLSWLHGRYRAPPEFEQAIERLTGDAELAREIVELIPSRNGHGPMLH